MCAKTGTGLGKPCVLPEGHEGECKGYLGALPLDVKYRSLREAVPYSQKTLDRLTRPLLSLSPNFKPQKRGSWDKPTNKEPIYPAWQSSLNVNGMQVPRTRSGSMPADWYAWNNAKAKA